MRSVSFLPLVYVTKPCKLILCDLIWQITCNNNSFGRWPLWQHWSYALLNDLIVLIPLKPIVDLKEWWVSHHDAVFKINWTRFWVDFFYLLVHSEYRFHLTGSSVLSTVAPLRRKAGLKFTNCGKASRTGPILGGCSMNHHEKMFAKYKSKYDI